MKPSHVIGLAALVLIFGIAIWYNDKPAPDSQGATDQRLFPELAQNLDSVRQLSARDAAGGVVTMERKDDHWTVSEKYNYRASTAKVSELILAASEAVQREQKTSDPQLYGRLGLRDLSDAESAAVQLSMSSPGQKYAVLVGSSSDRFGGSTFVRKPASEQSFLVSPALNVSTDIDSWLDTEIFNIESDDVQAVSVRADTGARTDIEKQAMFNSDFDLVDRPDGHALNDVVVRGLARGLTGLRFEDVKKSVAFAANDYKRLSVTYTLFSGVVIDVTLFYQEEAVEQKEPNDGPPRQPQYWLASNARFDAVIAQKFVPQPDADSDGEPTSGMQVKLTSADLADRRKQVEHINQTRKRWVYKITQARFDSMNQSAASLSVAPE